MDELVTWLRAQLDDDERVARQVMAEPVGFYIEAETDATNIMTVGAYIHRWTPKRVLAEVDAKRRVIETCAFWLYEDDRGIDPCASSTLRLLALPYADRPGYLDEWRP